MDGYSTSSLRTASRAVPRWEAPALRGTPAALLLSLALALGVLAVAHYSVVDDAYISFRYAHDLAAGQGLVFNPGEHVEGYSDLLWVLLLGVPAKLGLPLDVCAVTLGVACAALALVEAWRICRALGVGPSRAYAAIIALGLLQGYWQSMAFGLETGLYALLLARTLGLVVAGRSPVGAGICGALLFMTRPEGLAVIPLCCLYLAVQRCGRGRGARWDNDGRKAVESLLGPLVRMAAPWLAIVAAVTAWRLVYYHALLPNTVAAKSPPHSYAVLRGNADIGARYLGQFLLLSLPLAVGLLVAPLVAARRPAVWLLLAVVAAEVPVVLLNGGDWMPHHRLITPYAPLLAVLLGMALQGAVGAPEAASRWRLYRLGMAAVWVVALVLAVDRERWSAGPDLRFGVTEPCYARIAHSLAPRLLPTDVVSSEALGAFSYALPRNRSFDMEGLTDAHVAHFGTGYIPMYGKIDPAYTLLVARPDVIVVHDWPLIAQIAGASPQTYSLAYATYRLPFPLVPGCEKHMAVGVRRTILSRLSPALAALRAAPVAMPVR